MLSLAQADSYADQFLTARTQTHLRDPFPVSADVDINDAYLIARLIEARRIAQGDERIGRKIAFANASVGKKYGKRAPINGLIWTPLFASTVRYLDEPFGTQSLAGALQPRLAPEVVFKLARTPTPEADMAEIADCLEWMAHGLEVVVCPFPNWEFDKPDAIAAFALHGTLLIGEPHQISSATRQHLGSILGHTSISLSCGSTLLSAGFGSDVLESPLHALWHLQQLLKGQPEASTLQAGEIISTGTWTDLTPIKAGETWSTAFSGAPLAGLSISFT